MSAQPRRYVRSGVVLNVIIIIAGLIGIAILLLSQMGSDSGSPSTPSALGLTAVTEGLDQPVVLTGDGAGGRYVGQADGIVLALASDGTAGTKPFLDIHDDLASGTGLLGLVFHPDFAHDGRLYVSYIRAEDQAISISEFRAVDGSVDDRSERPILVIPRTDSSPRAASLAFDASGMLLIGVGGAEAEPAAAAPDPAALAGAILRIDVDHGMPYAIPGDNGFAGQSGARGELHAIGLREPAHMSIDRETGSVYVGDAGSGEQEIDVLTPGTHAASFGWPEMDGDDCRPGGACDPAAYITPAVTYPIGGTDGACGVVGGYAYRGTAGSLPLGTYVFADRCGALWSVSAASLQEGRVTPAEAGRVPAASGHVLGLGEDDAGELYLLTNSGTVYAIAES